MQSSIGKKREQPKILINDSFNAKTLPERKPLYTLLGYSLSVATIPSPGAAWRFSFFYFSVTVEPLPLHLPLATCRCPLRTYFLRPCVPNVVPLYDMPRVRPTM